MQKKKKKKKKSEIQIISWYTSSINTRQSAQWRMYTPDQRYRQFLKSTKYVALTLEMAVICFM